MNKIVYIPEECIGNNIYRKRIVPLQDVTVQDLKEVPNEARMQYLYLFLGSNLDDIYKQEFIKGVIRAKVRCLRNPEDAKKDLEKQVEKIKTLMTAQFIKENFSEFESNAFLDGKTEVFYISTTPLQDTDKKIGKVVACNEYDPIRKIRLPDYVDSCLTQLAGDLGCFQTQLDVKYAVWHDDLYYFF